MSDNGPCNCEQALEITGALHRLIEVILEDDKLSNYDLRNEARAAQEVLERWALVETTLVEDGMEDVL